MALFIVEAVGRVSFCQAIAVWPVARLRRLFLKKSRLRLAYLPYIGTEFPRAARPVDLRKPPVPLWTTPPSNNPTCGKPQKGEHEENVCRVVRVKPRHAYEPALTFCTAPPAAESFDVVHVRAMLDWGRPKPLYQVEAGDMSGRCSRASDQNQQEVVSRPDTFHIALHGK
jgi:hypothetical protein